MQKVMPILAMEDLESVRDYYKDVLGFDVGFAMKDPEGNIHTLFMQLGEDAGVMFGAANPEMPNMTPVNPEGLAIYFATEDVDAYHDSIAGKDGVDIVDGLTDQFWGDRTFIARDAWGLHLWFGQHTGQMSAPPEGFEVEMAQPVG